MTEWVEIVTEKAGEESVTKRVPKAWYENIRRVREINSYLTEEFMDVEGVTGVATTTGEEEVEGYALSQPVVYVEDEHVDKVPSEIDGIPIKTESPKGPIVLD